MAEPPVTFAGLLRKLRTDARLTQEELAEAAGLSPRSVSDLERGIAATPRRETVRLLAGALALTGPAQVQFEAVARGRTPPPGPAEAAVATRTLPRDIASFTGRQQELRELVEAAAGSGGVVGIHAIGGMAGVGKTAFAVHVAHQLAPRFPAGQIFLSLHGHTPGQKPVEPDDALATLLLTAGVSAGQIPSGTEARMALWRDRVAGQQLLLVLDDAASSEQVRPLLPGAGGSLVLVTSRRHLSALEDATAISLDTLPPDEAAGLLARLAGRPGLDLADPAVLEITRLCGYLPLAIGMVARQLHHHPAWSLAGQAAELTAAQDRLELMATENLSVAAAFNLSYEDLAPEQQRLFRRLGLHPGADIDAYAAAALDDTDPATARRRLEALYDQYLLTEPSRGRYVLHDLIRAHARALSSRLDPSGDRAQATARLLDYYQHTAARAQALLARQPETHPAPAQPAPAQPPPAGPDLPDRRQALTWARTERASLLACLDQATRDGEHARVAALTAALAALLRLDGPWTDAVTRHAAAVQAARHLGDRYREAGARKELGEVSQLANVPGAAETLAEALGLYRDLGDRLGQANALHRLGEVRRMTGDCPGAVEALQEALGLYRDLGSRLGQANALCYLGSVRIQVGDNPGATEVMEDALGIYRDIGDQMGQGNALSQLGRVRYMVGDYPGAAEELAEALGIYRDLNDRMGLGNTLTLLGAVWRTTGDSAGAVEALEEALGLYRGLGDRLGQASVLHSLGYGRRASGDYPGAAQALDEALGIYHDLGSRLGQANVLTEIGAVRRVTGDSQGAAQALEDALAIYRASEFRGGEIDPLNELGTLHRTAGDLDQAGAYHREALDLARQVGRRWDEAQALAGLARCALAAGRAADAQDGLRQALEIFNQLGAADEAADITAELDTLPSSGLSAPAGS